MNMDNETGGQHVHMATKEADDSTLNQFPAGLRVLAVDDDITTLIILEKMLKACLYEVTTCRRAEDALSMLRESKNKFDIVLSDLHMPNIDGLKLMEIIGLEMDLPVVMMSSDDGEDIVTKGIIHGACDYFVKPVRIDALKFMWQHVIRKQKNRLKDLQQSSNEESGELQLNQSNNVDHASLEDEANCKSLKKKKDENDEGEDRDDMTTLKKPRVVWSPELHQEFVAAVNKLGLDKAVPKKILEHMKVPGLTRENVASHLQKYRLYLRKMSGMPSQHSSGYTTPFMGSQVAKFEPSSSLDGYNIQAYGTSTQLSQTFVAQQLPPLQPLIQDFGSMNLQAGEGTPNFLNIPMSFGDFLANTHGLCGNQSGSLMMQTAQNTFTVPMLNEFAGDQVSVLPSAKPIFSNEYEGQLLRESETSTMSDLLEDHVVELSGHNFLYKSNSSVNIIDKNASFVEEGFVSLDEQNEYGNSENIAQHCHNLQIDDSFSMKADNMFVVGYEPPLFVEDFDYDDPMIIPFKE